MLTFAAISRYTRKLTYLCMGYGFSGRSLYVFPDDVFLVGYPKSGNTWLDFLVACLRSGRPEKVNFDSVETLVADIYYNDSRMMHNLARPRFLKSHEPFDSRYSKVVYIVRDPRAVAISYYHYLRARKEFGKDYPLDRFVSEFIQGRWDNYGTWEEHTRGWLSRHRQDKGSVMIVRYEDLKSETEQTLINIALFLNIVASKKSVQEAVAWARPENMRRLEESARKSKSPRFSGFRDDSHFVRKASSDHWRQELDQASKKKIEDAWADTMREFGYQ